MKLCTAIPAFILFACFHACTAPEATIDQYQATMVSRFNEKILEIAIADDNLLTLKGVRTAAMAHLAIHDALNSIIPVYGHYVYHELTPGADPETAAAYAAYTIVVDQYPDEEENFKQLFDQYVQDISEESGKVAAQVLGQASAKAVLKHRALDKWNGIEEYTMHPMAPGVYAEFNEHSGTPEGFVFGAGWAVAKPFALPDHSYFRAPPPPEINSEAYTEAFEEVKSLGGYRSEGRTEDQTHLAMWWKEFVESSHNKLARDLVAKEGLNLWMANRAYALMNMAIYDGYVNVFDNKFHYNHWRPYTAIRWAENDGNPDTRADLEWNNLHRHTYPFPSYPSAHGTASTAAMTILASALGKGDAYPFTMVQTEVDSAGFFSGKMKMNPSTRSFTSFSQAGMEASLSRVYLGIHFRYDSVEGHRLGAQIGNYVFANYLRPFGENPNADQVRRSE